MTHPSTRCGGRRPKSAKARSRGKLGTGWQRVLWRINVGADLDDGRDARLPDRSIPARAADFGERQARTRLTAISLNLKPPRRYFIYVCCWCFFGLGAMSELRPKRDQQRTWTGMLKAIRLPRDPWIVLHREQSTARCQLTYAGRASVYWPSRYCGPWFTGINLSA